jgi:competence protein ComEA
MKALLAALAVLGLAAAPALALGQKAEAPKAAAASATALMDINTASETELATLKGVGEVRAKAIVKGRPYKGKDDLLRRKIVPKNVYADIKDQIIARQ